MSPDTPTPGYYRTRLVTGGPWCPVHIWFGEPLDPVTGEPLDRGPRWQATVRGLPYDGDVLTLWLWSAKHPITKGQYDYLVAVAKHAVEHEPDMPEAAPTSAIDYLKTPPVRF